MKARFVCFLLLLLAGLASQVTLAHGTHDAAVAPSAQDEHDAPITLAPAMQLANGVTTALAAPGVIERHVRVYGRLATPNSKQAQVRARFAGRVLRLHVELGQWVSAGAPLVTVEANDSLQAYVLRAPITGQVVALATRVGDITGSEPLLVIADNRQLVAELDIFPSQQGEVVPGLDVHVETRTGSVNGKIASLVPSATPPFASARVLLPNAGNKLLPGAMVTALVDAEKVAVGVRVDKRAVQQMDGHAVVFVAKGERFYPRVVSVGKRDDKFVEITQGLAAGEAYVVTNSYLLKADAEKAGAEHHH